MWTKGEIAHHEQFLLLSQRFQKSSFVNVLEWVCKWEMRYTIGNHVNPFPYTENLWDLFIRLLWQKWVNAHNELFLFLTQCFHLNSIMFPSFMKIFHIFYFNVFMCHLVQSCCMWKMVYHVSVFWFYFCLSYTTSFIR